MAQSMSVNSANQFIGSRISLISKSDIRYEGILYALDLRDSTISLAKVRSFGTEDRPTERPIPMKDEIYEFIIFRGSDIKSIDVTEPPKAGSTMPCGLPQDPAIIEVSHFRSNSMGGGMGHSHNCNGMEHSSRYSSNRTEAVFDGLLRGGNGRHQGNHRRSSNENGTQVDRRNGGGRNYNNRNTDGRSRQENGFRGGSSNGSNQSRSGRGNTPNRNNQSNRGSDRDHPRANSGNRGQGQNRQRGIIEPQLPPKVTFENPFDFEKSNEELKTAMEKIKLSGGDDDKTKEGEVTVKEEKKEDPMCYYDKDKFFDNISCEALERSRGKVSRVDWQAERKLNAETFGLPWNPNHPRNQRNGQRNNGYRPRSTSRGGGYRGGNNQMRYNNYNNRFNNNRNSYGNRGQQQRT